MREGGRSGQQVRAAATEAHHLGLGPRTHMAEGGNWLPKVALWSPQALTTPTPYKINKQVNKCLINFKKVVRVLTSFTGVQGIGKVCHHKTLRAELCVAGAHVSLCHLSL